MALEDIKNKITAEAKQKAQVLLNEAKVKAAEKISEAEKKLKQQRTVLHKETEHLVKVSVQQRSQLAQLETAQAVLAQKRKHLSELNSQVKQELLNKHAEQLLEQIIGEIKNQLSAEAYFVTNSQDQQLLTKVLQKNKINFSVRTEQGMPLGAIFAVSGKSRIDCSINSFIEEKLQGLESLAAEELFAK